MNNNDKQAWCLPLVSALCVLTTSSQASPVNYQQHTTTRALHWWNETNELYSGSVQTEPPEWLQPPVQQKLQGDAARLNSSGSQNLFTRPSGERCTNRDAFSLSSHCILKSTHNHQGLQEQIRYLRRVDPHKRVAPNGANISNARLLKTARDLLLWEESQTSLPLQDQFSLHQVNHPSIAQDSGNYTGYFTPVLQVKSRPDAEFTIPVYAPPKSRLRLSRQQIDQGALHGRGLELVWTNDPVNLFFAQTQGSAIAQYPDGYQRYLDYAGHNGYDFEQISDYLARQGYMRASLSNANIRRWLHANPHKMYEVLHHNPRYIYFNLTDRPPRTTTGSSVIPWHTVAVDDRYIPLGAVLLAEIPRIDHNGKQVGRDWRLLFAQDRGAAIKGPGRLDMYTGRGNQAEKLTYRITGTHRTYLLISNPERYSHLQPSRLSEK